MHELLSMADDDSKQLWNNLKLCYTESQGHPDLRAEVADSFHSVCSSDNVIVGAPQELIYMAMRVLGDGCSHAIAPFPAYQSLYDNLKSIGVQVDKWVPELNVNSQKWQFSIPHLKSLIQANTKLIVVNFPHNPTGAVVAEQEWRELIELCKEKDIYLFSDEMYRYLDDGGNLSSASDLYEKAVSLFGVSKSLSLPGLRIGWLVTRDEGIMTKLGVFKDYLSICSSAPSEILALIAVRNRNLILTRNKAMISKNKALLTSFFEQEHVQENFLFPSAQSHGTTTFVKMRGPLLKRYGSATAFCKDLLEKKGVLLLPAKQYDFNDVYFRLGFARANLPEVLQEFSDFLIDFV